MIGGKTAAAIAAITKARAEGKSVAVFCAAPCSNLRGAIGNVEGVTWIRPRLDLAALIRSKGGLQRVADALGVSKSTVASWSSFDLLRPTSAQVTAIQALP